MKFLLITIFLLSVSFVYSQNEEVVTNQTVLKLQKAGLSKEVIKSKIQSSNCNFDLSTDGLIALKKAAVPDDIINAMLAKSATLSKQVGYTNTAQDNIPLSSGIYYLDSVTNNYLEFDPSVLSNQKSGGFGESLKRSFSTLFNSKLRASLSGNEAHTKFNTNKPTFLFVFDSTAGGFSNSNTVWSTVQSPNEFFLIKLTVVKNSREVVVGKQNNIKSDIGVDDELKVAFTIKKLKKAVYEVIPSGTLSTGEYCFMFAASSMYSGQTHKVYDFSVR